MKSRITQIIAESISVKQQLLDDPATINRIQEVSELAVQTFKNGGKVLFCGNGGSAADAQHLATELSGRFLLNRDPLFAEALNINTSYLTAVANDFSFDEVFARILKAKGQAGDLLFALSTSGNSKNVLRAAEEAQKIGMPVIGFTKENGGQLKAMTDHCFCVPTASTARAQEAHLLIGHVICELVESKLFSDNS